MTKAEIQYVRALGDKRMRDGEGLFIAEGHKLVEEIIASPLHIRQIYTTRRDIVHPKCILVEPRDMERISQLKSANDSLAVVEKPRYDMRSLDPRRNLVVALDGVQNPGNLGTILRLADWFGVEDVVCSLECADCFSPKVVQATMGAILRVKVHYTGALSQFLADARSTGAPIYGTLLDGENIYNYELKPSGVVVMGNEGRGLSDACAKELTHRLFIPPYPADAPTSESLNVAMATGIILAEFRRPR